MSQYVYSPHYDFYINKSKRDHGYSMSGFHMHKKYELYYQISGSRRYVIENGTYFINAGSLVLIDKTEIHKTVSVNDDMYARYVLNFSESYLSGLTGGLEGVDLLSCFHSGQKVLALILKQRAVIETLLGRMDGAKESLSAGTTRCASSAFASGLSSSTNTWTISPSKALTKACCSTGSSATLPTTFPPITGRSYP